MTTHELREHSPHPSALLYETLETFHTNYDLEQPAERDYSLFTTGLYDTTELEFQYNLSDYTAFEL